MSEYGLVEIAEVCHEANRVLQKLNDELISPHWDEAPTWQKDSAVDGVKKALDGYTPEQLHESWCEFKTNDGWIYGSEKNEDEKTHPCLVPYNELPFEQIIKDDLFHAIVKTLGSDE